MLSFYFLTLLRLGSFNFIEVTSSESNRNKPCVFKKHEGNILIFFLRCEFAVKKYYISPLYQAFLGFVLSGQTGGGVFFTTENS